MTTLLYNTKVNFEYEIIERFQAGIELFGFEVKALRSKLGSLEGAYVTVRGNEAFLIKAYIPPFQQKNTPADYEPERNRKLLLTKKELLFLSAVENQAGLTIVPISLYNSKRSLKIEIAIVRGKKKYDKRETIKKRDTERDIRRELLDR